MSVLDVVKMLLPLFVILLILLGALYIVKKTRIATNGNGAFNIDIKILTAKSILPKKYIAVVKVDEKILILGVSDNSINLLKEMDYDAEKFNTNEIKTGKFFETFKKKLKINE